MHAMCSSRLESERAALDRHSGQSLSGRQATREGRGENVRGKLELAKMLAWLAK